MKESIRDQADERIALVDWVPLFGRDYRYTVTMRACIAATLVVGVVIFLLGIGIYLFKELPYASWREAQVTSKVQTNSRCLVGGDDQKSPYTYRYMYVVDDVSRLTTKGYCDGVSMLIYNPSNPDDAVPKPNGLSAAFVTVIVGILVGLSGYAGTALYHRYITWTAR